MKSKTLSKNRFLSPLLKLITVFESHTSDVFYLMCASMIANILNFAFNAYLGRKISLAEFGLVSLIGSFLSISTIPVGALSKAVTYRSAFLFGKYNSPNKQFWSYIRKRALLISFLATALWILTSPLLVSFFNAPSVEPFLLFAPAIFLTVASAVDKGFIGGILKFKNLAVLALIEAVSKLIIVILLVSLGFSKYVYASIPLSIFFVFLVGWFFARQTKQTGKKISPIITQKLPTHFFASSMLLKVSGVGFLTFDLILAKHFLDPVQAGQYALLSLVGKIIFYVGEIFGQFINPFVSKEEGASKNSKIVFYKLFISSFILSFTSYLVVGFFGYISAPLLFGNKVNAVTSLLPIYGVAMLMFTLANAIVTFEQIKKRTIFPFLSFIFALAQILGIGLFHSSILQIVIIMTVIGTLYFLVVLILHFLHDHFGAIKSNVLDFIDLWDNTPLLKSTSKNYRIIIFNWRDIKHIWAGGAEVYIHEISKLLVKKGHQVTIFCGNDGKSPRYEIIDGIRIIRRGGFYTVYIWAFLYYILKLRNKVDIIIDSENGVPFFTPLYARKPIIGLIHHVHQEIFRNHLSFPFAQIASFIEGKLMPLAYKNTEMITVSESSKKDMEKIGFGLNNSVNIINPGVNIPTKNSSKKTSDPQILYLGRLKPYKSVDVLIKSLPIVINKIPKIKLVIAGEGESRNDLETLVSKLKLENNVEFLGFISENKKTELLKKSWVMVQPSKMEGWGITVIEANSYSIPVIASNVPGLRDSICDSVNGMLVPWGDKENLAKLIVKIITNKNLLSRLSQTSKEWSKNFTWEKSAQQILNIIDQMLRPAWNIPNVNFLKKGLANI